MAVPAGEKITLKGGKLSVPNNPIIPFIEGDGTGRDIWRASQARVRRRGGEGLRRQAQDRLVRGLRRREGVQAGRTTGCPTRPSTAFREYLVGIKGPLTTPVGGGIRSLNVALRQMLDLYVCLRPVRYFKGVPSPVKHPEKVDMVIFRENTEDIYAGIEFEAGTPRRRRRSSRSSRPSSRSSSRRSASPRRAASASSRSRSDGTRAPGPRGDPVRARPQAQERDPRAQGQHHEVHRGRVPRLGLRPRGARVRGQGLHLGSVGADQGEVR